MEKTNILSIPKFVLLSILFELDFIDLLSVSGVSKRFWELANSLLPTAKGLDKPDFIFSLKLRVAVAK